ncbi:GMC oxidoreductase [Mesorhizobium sp.]|uniref:GMC oxidoreductase n=1 Tax=Mesorhizobium sp. TaxID=1871066 RepID=UPI000FE7FD56|nr:GMC oxidoreductase [Mesorhizobium sp.]RWP58621.1 MAG: hypothetical protein EOR08_26635 [Mesorhizobium sp.]
MDSPNRRRFLAGVALTGVSSLAPNPSSGQESAGAGSPGTSEQPKLPPSIDVLGTLINSAWEDIEKWQAEDPASNRFDLVVIGGGTFGAYLADKVYRRASTKDPKILVVDQGPFFLATHVQNLGRSVTASIPANPQPSESDPVESYRDGVWSVPWASNEKFKGIAYCFGGRSVFWAGWSPRFTDNDLALWPTDIEDFLLSNSNDGYSRVEAEIGASDNADYIAPTALFKAFESALEHTYRKVVLPGSDFRILTGQKFAPLAVMASSPQPGLFPYDKFSSAAFLANAICEDRNNKALKERHLFFLPRTRVIGLNLNAAKNAVESIRVICQGIPRTIPIAPTTAVALANGTIEAARLALNDLQVGEAVKDGKKVDNLMAHLRSNIKFKIRRTALQRFYQRYPTTPSEAEEELATFIVRGEHRHLQRRFHFQVVVASVKPDGAAEDHLWKMVPDIELVDDLLRGRDNEFVQVIFRGVGEMGGVLTPHKGESFVDNTGGKDTDSVQRARVTLTLADGDKKLWDAMDMAAIRLAYEIAGRRNEDLFFLNGAFQKNDTSGNAVSKEAEEIISEFDTLRDAYPPGANGGWRDPLGWSHHEGGTLYMGSRDTGAKTNTTGRLHGLTNVFVVGPAVFPTIGSANPVLTGLALTRLTSAAIIGFIGGELSGDAKAAALNVQSQFRADFSASQLTAALKTLGQDTSATRKYVLKAVRERLVP